MNKESICTLVTFPRCGKNWLNWCINTNTDLTMNFIHYTKLTENDKIDIDEQWLQNNEKILSYPIITIVREPIESLASIYTMENFQFNDFRYQQYIDHFEFILEKAVLLFNYEDLRTKTNLIVQTICEKFNGNIINDNYNFNEYQKWHLETQNKNKLITSKNNDLYNKALEIAHNQDLSIHNKLYSQAKNKCIVLQ